MGTLLQAGAVVLGGLALHVVGCQNEAAPPPIVASGGGVGQGGTAGSGSGTGATDGGVTTVSHVTTLALGVSTPASLALGPDVVYWTTAKALSSTTGVGDASAGTGSIESVPRAGGAVREIVRGLSSPGEMAVYSGTLFFGAKEGAGDTLEAFRVGTTTVTSVAVGQSTPLCMFLSESTLYWATGNGARLTLDSVSTETPTESAVQALTGIASGYVPVAITVIGTDTYILASMSGDAYVLHVTGAGGAPTVLWHESSVTPVDLGGAGETLYWALSETPADGGQVLSEAVGGGELVTLATGQAAIGKLAVASSTVYFTTSVASGALYSVSTGGGAVATLATGLDYPGPLVVDDAVYVGTTSSIVRVAF